MHIGIFSDSINIPPKEGINVHTYNVAITLAQTPGVKVLLVVCDRGWLDIDALKKQPFDTLVLPSIVFYDYKEISRIIDEYKLDVIQTYMVYFAAMVMGRASFETKVPMVVEFHDLEKVIVPLYLNDEKEINYHDNLQRQSGNLASMVRVMSKYDYETIRTTWPELKAKLRWMPANIKGPSSVSFGNKQNGALFIGNTSYPPNADAASYIEKELAPNVPNISFSLIGRGTDKYAGSNINALGLVDKLDDYLSSHKVGLAPIFAGSGMKIKLLDYLSAGMPVITTSIGAKGYPRSQAILIEDDMTKWPELLESIVHGDEVDLEKRSRAAHNLFLKHFDLEQSISQLIELYNGLSYQGTATPANLNSDPVDQSKIYWLSEIRETPRRPVQKMKLYRGCA